MDEHQRRLRVALWVAIGVLLVAIPWTAPYGYFIFTRLVVWATSVYAVYVLREIDLRYQVALVCIALLFNPVILVELTKLLWVPIDIGVAYLFWLLATGRPLPGVLPKDQDQTEVPAREEDE